MSTAAKELSVILWRNTYLESVEVLYIMSTLNADTFGVDTECCYYRFFCLIKIQRKMTTNAEEIPTGVHCMGFSVLSRWLLGAETYCIWGWGDHFNMELERIQHSTKNVIYIKFTQCQFGAKKWKLGLNERTKMVNTSFAFKFTTPCKLASKCGIYHLCSWFPPSLHFFASYLHRVNLSNSSFPCSAMV